MNTPNPLSKLFQLQLNDNHFEIHLNAISTKLSITIYKKTTTPYKKYEACFSLEELITQSKWFRIFESSEEALNELCSLFNDSQFKIKEEFNLIICSFSTSLRSTDEIQILIPEIESQQEDKFAELCSTVDQLNTSLSIIERKFHIIENSKDYKKYFDFIN